MNSEQAETLSQLVAALWSESAAEKDYKSILKIGFQVYSIYDLAGQDAHARACLEGMKPAFDVLLRNSEKLDSSSNLAGDSCSFCGKMPPDVRLGAGSTAFICNECVAVFSNIFSKETL